MTAKRYIQIPRGYLSHSQRELWKRSREEYARRYFDGEPGFSTPAMEYGKIVADALEAEQETGDLLTDSALLLLPKYDIRDQAFTVEVRTKDGWLVLLAKPDYMQSDTYDFIEVKTGKQPWTQARAEAHPQLLFYATCIWQKYGVMLEWAKLAWVETEWIRPFDKSEAEVRPTGRVETFEVPFTKAQYYETLADMTKTAKEIEIAWAAHVTPEYIKTF